MKRIQKKKKNLDLVEYKIMKVKPKDLDLQ